MKFSYYFHQPRTPQTLINAKQKNFGIGVFIAEFLISISLDIIRYLVRYSCWISQNRVSLSSIRLSRMV